jgi:hypothetical protein
MKRASIPININRDCIPGCPPCLGGAPMLACRRDKSEKLLRQEHESVISNNCMNPIVYVPHGPHMDLPAALKVVLVLHAVCPRIVVCASGTNAQDDAPHRRCR